MEVRVKVRVRVRVKIRVRVRVKVRVKVRVRVVASPQSQVYLCNPKVGFPVGSIRQPGAPTKDCHP